MTTSLSVIMPIHNEASHLPATIDALVEAVAGSGFEADLVLVDDGSTDGSAEVVRTVLGDRLPLTVVAQPNRGRFEARREGLQAATGEWVLLLDGRVLLDQHALEFVHPRVGVGANVWTGHVRVEDGGTPFGIFWRLIAELAWAEYFENARTTSFSAMDFDRYPKGSGCFLAPRTLLLEATAAFHSRYADPRRANDDTPVIRWIAEAERINVSPHFACAYRPRMTLRGFVRHSFHRGIVFLDGHGRPESRFFPAVVGFYPVSVVLALAAMRRPTVVPWAIAATSLTAAGLGIARRRRVAEIASLALLTPVYAAAHGAGMWRGLAMVVDSLLRARPGAATNGDLRSARPASGGARPQPRPPAMERSRRSAEAAGDRRRSRREPC